MRAEDNGQEGIMMMMPWRWGSSVVVVVVGQRGEGGVSALAFRSLDMASLVYGACWWGDGSC